MRWPARAAEQARALGLDPVTRRARRRRHGRGTGGRGPRRALRRPRRGRPPHPGPSSCCSATPSTTRPRPCCSASPAAAGPPACRAWPPHPAATGGRCSASGAPRPCRPAPTPASSRGPTRTTPTPPTPGCGCATEVLPVLERELGPGIAEALARTAEQLREDAEALDGFAEEVAEDLADHAEAGISLPVRALATQPACAAPAHHPARRRERVRRRAQPGADPRGRAAGDRLARAGGVDLPGVRVVRRAGSAGVLGVRLSTGDALEETHGQRGHRRSAQRGAAHRGADPRSDRRAVPRDRGATTRAATCCWSACCAGAVMVMADLARELRARHRDGLDGGLAPTGAARESSGVVRILKDLDTDLIGRNVLIVEDIIDSGLTLSWLRANLESRGAASVEICALLRKPEAAKVEVDARVRRLRDPERVRGRLRPRLRRALPQPPRGRRARPARVRILKRSPSHVRSLRPRRTPRHPPVLPR